MKLYSTLNVICRGEYNISGNTGLKIIFPAFRGNKSNYTKHNLIVGDLVLIMNQPAAHSQFSLACMTHVNPDKLGVVHSVTLQARSSIWNICTQFTLKRNLYFRPMNKILRRLYCWNFLRIFNLPDFRLYILTSLSSSSWYACFPDWPSFALRWPFFPSHLLVYCLFVSL